jgi:hypothetical protein
MVWCDWEQKEFEDGPDRFKPYGDGSLKEHLGVKPRHTTNGLEIGGPGPEPKARRPGEPDPSGPGVTYGYGPMARPPEGE